MGITPAYAGNTYYVFSWQPPHRDHPRLRGEHGDNTTKDVNNLGSPPPTRGTQTGINFLTQFSGITPAYAGNTHCESGRLPNNEDHPRLRGEHCSQLLHCVIRRGSPPPTRGTRFTGFLSITSLRITPAYAGNTLI